MLTVPRRNLGTARPSSRSRGQSIAEFVLILPILMLLLLITIDFGRVYLGWVNLQNMARIAANYAANYPNASWGPGSDYDAQIQADATTINCTLPSTLPAPTFPDGSRNIGDPAKVSLTCDFQLLTPLLGNILGNPVQVGASAVFPIKGGIIGGVPVSGVLPTPTPTTGPTPTPTTTPPPKTCTVPYFLTTSVDDAQTSWNSAGFVPTNFTITFGVDHYVISSESPKNQDGASKQCDTFKMTVGP